MRSYLYPLVKLALAALLTSSLNAATPLYKGRPIVRVTYPQQHPNLGYTPSFGSVQFYGDGVHYIALDNQYTNSGLYYSAGSTPADVASPTLVLPDSFGPLKSTEYNFRSHAADGTSVFAVETTDDKLAYLKINDQGTLSILFDASTVKMPASGDLAFTRLGEANSVGSQVAFIGFHNDSNNQTLHRGVYVLENGTLSTIADTNTVLPGGVGSFDGSSSQVGFDGTTVAFWGIHGSAQTNDQRAGIFTSTIGGTIAALAVDGDLIPGTSTPIDSFLSPPVVVGPNVYFGAFDASSQTYLLRSKDGVLETLIKPGDTIDDQAITQIANAGFDASGDTVYFNALKNSRSVILSQTGDDAPVVAIDDTIFPGFHQFAVRDVEGDRIIFSDSTYIYATLDSPAIPVLTRDLTGQGATLDAGASTTLSVDALGEGPLSYEWRLNNVLIDDTTGPSLEIPDFQAANAGNYSLRVVNDNGTAYSANANLLLNSKPIFQSSETPVIIEAGYPLNLTLNITGLTPMTYQWYKDGSPIENVTIRNYITSEATTADSGIYNLKATNSLGEATSADIVVTVNPAPENPAWDGRQFDSIFSFPTTIGGVEVNAFSTTATFPGGFIANSYDTNSVYNAIIFIPNAGDPTALLTVDSLNAATGLNYANITLSAADTDGNIIFYAQDSNYSQIGVYVRETNGTITKLAAKGDAVPGLPEKTFTGVYPYAIDGSTRIYLGTHDGVNSFLVKVDTEGSSIVVDTSTPLPVGGFTKSATPYLLENGSFYFTARSNDNLQTALFHYAANGNISLVIKTGDPIGDQGDTLAGYFYAPQKLNDKLYLGDSNLGIVEVGDRSATLVLGPNAPIVGGGTMSSVSSFVAIYGNTAYLAQNYKPGDGSTRSAIFAWDGTDLKLAFSPSHIDQRRLLSNNLTAVSDTGVIYSQVTYPGYSRALVANTGAEVTDPDPDPIVVLDSIDYEILSTNLVRIYIPDGKTLQSSPGINTTWTDVAGTIQIDITLTGERIFFRLRPQD